MTESALLPDTNTIALWMLVAITIVIAAKVVTGVPLGQRRKEIYKIREKLFVTRQERPPPPDRDYKGRSCGSRS
ncbi:MAG: hypothetical protein CME13_20975 [Gemmatimonadetes bacterium]|jgi:hypothetical protein|nr:hypothetical protein [Gemmatimonadota bacterium]MDP7632958.1 hypothetical protein [Candidatus Latescibacterota bacterium]HCV22491.1 hypothetical protein [Candidatus Latescibacterota bacterium]|tara:strand:- start:3896 stop:4117 length:222 start_codon:yes stop_codon:yes gene_type:complete